jgi:hypothetical protein
MPRYYFDMRDPHLVRDEEGVEFRDIEEAKIEGARCLAEMAKDRVPGVIQQTMIVEVKDENRLPLLELRLRLEAIVVASAA